MTHCEQRLGETTFRTPRNTIKAFVGLLAVLEQNPGADWKGVLSGTQVEMDQNEGEDVSSELAKLKL